MEQVDGDRDLPWRFERTRAWMADRGFAGLAVYSYRSALTGYWTGYFPRTTVTNASLFVLTAEAALHVTRLPIHANTAQTGNEAVLASNSARAPWAVGSVAGMVESAVRWLDEALPEGTIAFAAYEPEDGAGHHLSESLGPRLVNQTAEVMRLISTRSDRELDYLRSAWPIAMGAVEAGVRAALAGSTSDAVEVAMSTHLLGHGVRRWHSFVSTPSASGTVMGSTGAPLRPGDMLFVEVIPDLGCFGPEIVANVFVERVPDAVAECHRVVEESLRRLLRNLGAAATYADVFAQVAGDLEEVRARVGGSVFRVGHATGFDNIELPEFLGPDDRSSIGANRLLSVHPCVDLPGLGTIVRGGTVIVHEGHAEPMFRFPEGPLVAGAR